jgi:hypothetical protein
MDPCCPGVALCPTRRSVVFHARKEGEEEGRKEKRKE